MRMKMNVVVLILSLVAVWLLGGCQAMAPLFDTDGDNVPDRTMPTVPIDEDGDGVPDLDAFATETGLPLTDPTTGQPAEVPGSRDKYIRAAGADTAVGGLLEIAGLLGIPLAAGAGALWSRKKPVQRVAALETFFRGLVTSVQGVRQKAHANGSLAADDLDESLEALNRLTPALDAAIRDTKETLGLRPAGPVAITETETEPASPAKKG